MTNPNPQNTYAVIVGIEKYDKSVSDNLPGAASSALGFAKWLYEQKVPNENIFLFISELDENKSLVENCQFNVRKAISSEIVDDAIATKIRQKQGEWYILYIFWAGHGYINQVENRRLLFSIEEQVKEKQLSLSMLLKQLRTDDFSCFDKQILLIDACATYHTFTNYLDVPIPGGEKPNNNCEQIVLLATKPGETAKYNNNSGLFSEVLFTELRNQDKLLLPEEMKEIIENIRKVFNEDEKYKNEQIPIELWYSYRDKDGRKEEQRLGLTKSAQISILLKERLKGLSSILSEISDRYILYASCYFVLLGFSKDVNGNYPKIDLLKSEDTAQEEIPKILEELLFKLTNNKDVKPVIEFVCWLLIILINSEEIKKKLKDWNKKTRDELNKINIILNIKPIKTKIDKKIISYREAYKNCHLYLVIVYKPKYSGKIYLSAELIFQKDNDEAKLKFQIAHEIEVALTNIHDKFDNFLLFSYKIINLYGFTDKQLIVEIFLPIQQLKKHSDESYEKIEIKIDNFSNDRQWIGCYHKFAFRSFERLDAFSRVPLSTIK